MKVPTWQGILEDGERAGHAEKSPSSHMQPHSHQPVATPLVPANMEQPEQRYEMVSRRNSPAGSPPTDSTLAALQLKFLGCGSFGVVRQARDRQTGELVAVKLIERGAKVRLRQGAASMRLAERRVPLGPWDAAGRSLLVYWLAGACTPPPLPGPSLGGGGAPPLPRLTASLPPDHPIPAVPQIDRNVERELINHRQLSGHPNIIRFREVFVTATHLCIVMEFAAGGELFNAVESLRQLEEPEARHFFQQLVCGVAWCHYKVRAGWGSRVWVGGGRAAGGRDWCPQHPGEPMVFFQLPAVHWFVYWRASGRGTSPRTSCCLPVP